MLDIDSDKYCIWIDRITIIDSKGGKHDFKAPISAFKILLHWCSIEEDIKK